MAGILDTFSRAQRFFFPIIYRGVREGLSANRILDLVRGEGGEFRRQRFLELIREIRGVQATKDILRFLSPGDRPNPDRLPEALHKIRRAFSFTVEVRGLVAGTDKPMLQHVTVTTDRILTREEVEEAASRAVERAGDRYGIEIQESIILHGVKAGPLGTL